MLPTALVNHIIVPTPQNTPLTHTPVSAGLSRTTVLDISEDVEPAEETTMPSRAVRHRIVRTDQGWTTVFWRLRQMVSKRPSRPSKALK
jgi:hypothetical protein